MPEHTAHPRLINKQFALLLGFIFIDQICHSHIIRVLSDHYSYTGLGFCVAFLLVQIVASPIQAGYSDFYCRRRSLIFSLTCSGIAMGLALLDSAYSRGLFLVPLAILGKAALGNTLGLSWAAIADIRHRQFRIAFAISIAAIASAYLMIITLHDQLGSYYSNAAIMGALFLSAYLAFREFRDARDRVPHEFDAGTILQKLKEEVRRIFTDLLGHGRVRLALLTFFLWEYSFYIIFMSDVELSIAPFNHVSLAYIIGTYVGVALLRYTKLSDEELISCGLVGSLMAEVPMAMSLLSTGYTNVLSITCYGIYAAASAVMVPCIFSIITKERQPHETGKVYGLMDSTDSIAILFAISSLYLYKLLGAPGVPGLYLVYASLLIFAMSLYPYYKFRTYYKA